MRFETGDSINGLKVTAYGRSTGRLGAGVISPQRWSLLLAVAAIGLVTTVASASVLVTGDVTPADNLLTPFDNEGLPVDGNFFDPFEPVGNQANFEGDADVIVGEQNFGSVQITGESALRYQDLVIGDQNTAGDRTGTGVVRITGFGSLYNNDPEIIPAGLPDGFQGTPPRDIGVGFDLMVGKAGNGTLEITSGARAEIQDSVIVGFDSFSHGTLIVEGIDTYLRGGGFVGSSGQPNGDEGAGIMQIGRLGVGQARFAAGATVVAASPNAVASTEPFGASIGGEPPVQSQRPEAGGTGMVEVDGLGTRWIIGSGLSVGGYHLSDDSSGGTDDFEGDDVEYDSEVGAGTLRVSNDGLVHVTPDAAQTIGINTQLAIGRFGRLELDGGHVIVGLPDGRIDEQFISNDGVISGGGQIDTGVFRNRYFGEVRVAADQHMLINSTSRFRASGQDDEALVSWGLIENIGGTLEVIRTPAPSTSGNAEAVTGFRNARLPATSTVTGRRAGRIVGQDANFRFGTGLSNQGVLAFTAGTQNIVSGDVVNEGESIPLAADEAVLKVSGYETFVTFEDNLTNAGLMEIGPHASGVEILGDFTNTGVLSLTLGGGDSGQLFSSISTAGMLTLGGELNVSLESAIPTSESIAPLDLTAGNSFEVFSATGGLAGDFASINLPGLGVGLQMIGRPDYGLGKYFLEIVSTVGAIGADFNGDGTVDDLDYLIWFANVGNPGPNGDANGDGIVNSQDFLIWQAQLGGAGMVPAAGIASIPEPTSWLLAMLALACLPSRRRG